MKTLYRVLPAATILVLAAGAVRADSIYDRYFGKADHGTPCYARSYDKAHLKKHPKQTVQQIQISYDVTQGDTDRPNSAAYFEIGLSFTLKRSEDWNGGGAYARRRTAFSTVTWTPMADCFT